MRRHLSIDIETFSSVDIKKAGLYKYVWSPDFQILLFAYSWDGGPVQIVDLAQGEQLPPEIVFALQDPNVIKHAYNAPFEWYCLNKFYYSPLDQWRCTMFHGLYCGYTAGLGATAVALGLPEDKRKMGIGMSLIRTFCVPCKPTKSNGHRTRTLPHHEPEKWKLFKEYCKQDVVTEMEIERRLSNFPVPDQEQKLWEIDQQINAYGVMVDRELIAGALHCSEVVTDELMDEAIKLSGLDNPKSVKQLTKWLEDETGKEIDNLRKDTVKDLIASLDNWSGKTPKPEIDTARRMLEIRQELSKTSVKKYTAMDIAVCDDSRVRGLLQFYGANRTGRWAGRLVQVQNLPRNYLETLAHARECVKCKKVDALKVIYGNVPDTLSQLIRTAFIPSPGNMFVVADFSAIEARVIAWLAGEQWRQDVFATHGKIYEASASAMFGVPIEKIKKGNPEYALRQKGKVAELACIAEGQLVLTDDGLKPIEEVTINNKVWDGVDFVSHDGVVFRGIKEVFTYDGLTATADHLVWVEGKPEPIRFDESAASGARLLRPGIGGKKVWLGRDHQLRKEMEKRLGRSQDADQVCQLRSSSMDFFKQPNSWAVKRMPALFPTKENTEMVRPEAYFCKATLYESERPELCQLWGKRHRIPFYFCAGSGPLGVGKSRPAGQSDGNRSDKQQWPLRTWEHSIYYKSSQLRQQTDNCACRMEFKGMAICQKCCYPETGCWDDPGTNHRGGSANGQRQTEKLEAYRSKARVYDILNAGPRNRFTVSDCLVHNCGYQGGVGALKAMGADQMGLSDEELHAIIQRWRSANRRIVDLWYSLENAALEVMRTGQPVGVKGLILARELDYNNSQDFFTITLPSRRKLFYPKPFLSQNAFGKEALHYHGVNQTTKKWEVISTYGGKITENIVQAVARDCLAESILRLNVAGYQTVMHVHDEVVLDVPVDQADLDRACEIMGQPIPWAPGLLLKAAGFVSEFYKKD